MQAVSQAVAAFWQERRVCFRRRFWIEIPFLRQHGHVILACSIFQYVHGMFSQLAHRMHQPQATPLGDIGFWLLPELGSKKGWVSELIFCVLVAAFVAWTLTPFVLQRQQFSPVLVYLRFLQALVVCQCLRIVSFSVTQLPGPAFHCRLGQDSAVRTMPDHWWQHLIVDMGRQATKGCGDLVFSSHTTFVLIGVLTYTENGRLQTTKVLAWLAAVANCLCIIASRKHYTVDVVTAWYTVPLVYRCLRSLHPPRRNLVGPADPDLTTSSESHATELRSLPPTLRNGKNAASFVDLEQATLLLAPSKARASSAGAVRVCAKCASPAVGLGDGGHVRGNAVGQKHRQEAVWFAAPQRIFQRLLDLLLALFASHARAVRSASRYALPVVSEWQQPMDLQRAAHVTRYMQ